MNYAQELEELRLKIEIYLRHTARSDMYLIVHRNIDKYRASRKTGIYNSMWGTI